MQREKAALQIAFDALAIGTDEVVMPGRPVDGAVFEKSAGMGEKGVGSFDAIVAAAVDLQPQRPVIIELDAVIERLIAHVVNVLRP